MYLMFGQFYRNTKNFPMTSRLHANGKQHGTGNNDTP
jgi:hypothetical protein